MRAALAERARRAASGAASALRAKGHPASELEKVLRRVTHADCAAIPSEDLEAAVRWAKRSEEALAKSLKHIQENIAADPSDWRRIHGALALFEALAAEGGSLVGRSWFEVKMQGRLKDLQTFRYDADPRVAGLVQRAAASANSAAEKLSWEDDGVFADEAPETSDKVPEIPPEWTGGAEDAVKAVKPTVLGRAEGIKAKAPKPAKPEQNEDPNAAAVESRCCCCCRRRRADEVPAKASTLTPSSQVSEQDHLLP